MYNSISHYIGHHFIYIHLYIVLNLKKQQLSNIVILISAILLKFQTYLTIYPFTTAAALCKLPLLCSTIKDQQVALSPTPFPNT